LLRTPLPEDEVPERLWQVIHQRLMQEVPTTTSPLARRLRPHLWLSLGSLAALLLVALAARLWLTPAVPLIVQEVVDSQIRARLMRVPYTQIPATPDAIRQWFDDKVDFAVLVPALPQARYAFLGTRLNYFLNRRVAEMAYASEGHVLSFVMFAAPGISLSAMSSIHVGKRTVYVQTYKGYTATFWQDGTLFCSLVSDLHLPALLEVLWQLHART
jgi:anti-sigma factor RsiW